MKNSVASLFHDTFLSQRENYSLHSSSRVGIKRVIERARGNNRRRKKVRACFVHLQYEGEKVVQQQLQQPVARLIEWTDTDCTSDHQPIGRRDLSLNRRRTEKKGKHICWQLEETPNPTFVFLQRKRGKIKSVKLEYLRGVQRVRLSAQKFRSDTLSCCARAKGLK